MRIPVQKNRTQVFKRMVAADFVRTGTCKTREEFAHAREVGWAPLCLEDFDQAQRHQLELNPRGLIWDF